MIQLCSQHYSTMTYIPGYNLPTLEFVSPVGICVTSRRVQRNSSNKSCDHFSKTKPSTNIIYFIKLCPYFLPYSLISYLFLSFLVLYFILFFGAFSYCNSNLLLQAPELCFSVLFRSQQPQLRQKNERMKKLFSKCHYLMKNSGNVKVISSRIIISP